MLKAIVIEDEKNIREYNINILKELGNIEVIASCGAVSEAKVLLNSCSPDVVFFDVELEDGTAFDILTNIENFNFKIVFITSYEQYALKAIKYGAFDYFLKPIDVDEVRETLDKVSKTINTQSEQNKKRIDLLMSELDGENDSITLKFKEGMRIVKFSEILYCFSESGYTSFYLDGGEIILVSKGLKEYEKLLPANIFFRTHKSYLVNKNYIQEYKNEGVLILRNQYSVPVASRRKDEVLKLFK